MGTFIALFAHTFFYSFDGPVDGDMLWMQDKHVSQHSWNVEEDRKLHVRRAVPKYQGQEEIPKEIIPLLRQSDFYWIMKMRYLKINVTLISALIENPCQHIIIVQH